MKATNTLLFFLFAYASIAQVTQKKEFAIYNTYANPISKEKVSQAQTLSDIKEGYPSTWVTDYISTEISININGDTYIVTGTNEVLTPAQLQLIKKAEVGDDINVEVKYNILNSVTHEKMIRTMNFKSSLVPDHEAEFIGGVEKLNKYLDDNIISAIRSKFDVPLPSLIANFSIDDTGNVTDVKMQNPSNDQRVNTLVIEVLSIMPNWRPAGLKNGKKISQKFVLYLGDVGC